MKTCFVVTGRDKFRPVMRLALTGGERSRVAAVVIVDPRGHAVLSIGRGESKGSACPSFSSEKSIPKLATAVTDVGQAQEPFREMIATKNAPCGRRKPARCEIGKQMNSIPQPLDFPDLCGEQVSPTCPACNSTELRHEVADRHQCESCGYRIIVSDDGSTRPWLAWESAGKNRSRRRARA